MKHDRLEKLLTERLRSHLAGARPRVPEPGLLLWSMFSDLNVSRSYNGPSPQPISHAEIEAWARLNRWSLEPHHVAILKALDGVWLDHAVERSGKTPTAGVINTRHAQPITAAAFDAVFG